MSRQLLETLDARHWDSGKPGSGTGFPRVRWLQGVSDLFNRPVINRAQATTSATTINTNGTAQSTGVGTQKLQPKRYAEFTVKARVTFTINSIGPSYIYVVRTLGAIPANGVPFNAGDVIVGGDAFIGGANTPGINQTGSFSFIDTGLDVNKSYAYYLAVNAPNGNILNLINSSQLFVLERS
jgi:hypothetical protein